jgi:hypothetical protein
MGILSWLGVERVPKELPDVMDWSTEQWIKSKQPSRGCTLCAHGNDLPDGEYCRSCGFDNRNIMATFQWERLDKPKW